MQKLDATLSRRDALKRFGAGVLLTAGMWPGALRAADQTGGRPFRFVVLNDIHFMGPECGRWLESLVRQIKSHSGTDLCLLAGDLTEFGRRSDFDTVSEIFNGLGMPFYTVIGNHDYLGEKLPEPKPAPSPVTAQSSKARHASIAPGKFDRRNYDEFFPRRLNYYFKHRGWQFVGLDTSEGPLYEKTSIQPATFRWVDDNLSRLNKSQPTVLFTHFPLGPETKYRPAGADALLDRFASHNIRAIFSGHFHGFTEKKRGETVMTTNRCCALRRGNHDGTKEKGYFLCEARDGRIHREFVVFKG